jgi:hypothetical protein
MQSQSAAASFPLLLQPLAFSAHVTKFFNREHRRHHIRANFVPIDWRRGRRSSSIAGIVPRVGFSVTNLGTSSQAVVRFYNKRGTAEQWIKEPSRRSR